jgi:UDP-N-acetylmuramate--alanine ligase
VRVIDGEIWFDLHTPQSVVYDLKLGVPAWVNIENSVAALAVAYLMGCEDEEMRNGVASFEGVYRRFNVHVNTTHVAYIDDYAHHPEELRASIESVRRLYGDRHVIGVFQPHLYTRTRDFVDEFAAVLSQLDEAILLPIYPARELPIEGVNSEWLLSKITTSKALVEKSQLVQYVSRRVAELKGQMKDAVVMTMGAGDIDRLVNDITKTLINEKND